MKSRIKLPTEIGLNAAFSTPLRLLLATTAAFWMGTVQPQTIAPAGARSPTELRFREFFRNPIGPAGPEISDVLRNADGRHVRLVGYMVQQEIPTPGRLLLAPRQVRMSEHADGQADDLPPATVAVLLDPSQSDWIVPHVHGLVAVTGTLHVGRHEAGDGRVSWVRLQLAAQGMPAPSAAELSGYLHHPISHTVE